MGEERRHFSRETEGIWASDMTFVPTSEGWQGWLYVAAVMNVKDYWVVDG